MARRARLGWVGIGVVVFAATVTWGVWLERLRPLDSGEARYVRFEVNTRREVALGKLQADGFVRDASALELFAKWRRLDSVVRSGTYRVRPGMTAVQVLTVLQKPIRQLVRIPEGWWIARTAALLEKLDVCSAQDYIDLASRPSEFARVVSFDLPKTSLEGYLFPDTYDLPPLLGARAVIERQLRAFESKVYRRLPNGTDLARVLNVAAMVELEAALDSERPKVAGVIENRLERRMRLEIDATVLYALQEWKILGPGVVRTVDSPYNTYLNAGLPPGPIGSPGWKSIQAAVEPEAHDYLFYVALPDLSHLFAKSYDEHRANIRKRIRALREERG